MLPYWLGRGKGTVRLDEHTRVEGNEGNIGILNFLYP